MKYFEKSKELKELITEIDVSDSNYEKVIQRYNSIANYIHDNPDIKDLKPDIYIQGSFKLGTAIKPLAEDGSYDIDIVCNLIKLNRFSISQAKLKEDVGNIVKAYANEKSMKNPAHESSRCWTLNYVDESNFHIDILPSVPYNDVDDGDIAITDKNKDSYYRKSTDWEISNPKGYADWFRDKSRYELYKKEYEKRIYAKIEEVPEYKIKTDLQRIVQILKRHAEVMFENKMEFKPSSIILTTLAAKVYYNAVIASGNFEELLLNVIRTLHKDIDEDNGNPCIFNPVNHNENLSMKWQKDEEYFNYFMLWIKQIRTDFNVDNDYISSKDRLFYMARSLRRKNTDIAISLKDLPHHQKSKWKVVFDSASKVKIKAFYLYKGFRYKEIKSGQALNKGGKLKFEVVGINLDVYSVFWQITNTGVEAESANCLRGDFYKSEIIEGKKIRKEDTKYVGRHYVEVYIVKNDICFYKSLPFEVNITKGFTLDWFRS
ncbi:nucleotidyltransferase [Clostridium cochlearium]|uniref:nucleotidyltransferase n=1 Tax=Clostridium cochlearium TaxID=1494 RepID=UPI001570BA54|nr:nucleotidyltransferase [Clostridium cochlearium]MBV1818119.1 nucleotidyltransferase [Bacteroidales bacterium MSK.15.36]MCG4580072.1 nucleotidyltransferase [Clostridium cochlearium]NSJ90917.1 nucleotidyltransferase [Coprococcus sp. MSK.21.13]